MTPNWIRTERMEVSLNAVSGGSEERILLIENDSDVADMFALGLNLSGYEVRVAGSADSAWTEFNQPDHAPELIVLDLELQSTGGLDVLNDLKRSPSTSSVPVIVLTSDRAEFGEAYRRGAADCHEKYRTTPRQLAIYVSAALGNRRARAS
jgi:DNA-binding response OmpR family regulator